MKEGLTRCKRLNVCLRVALLVSLLVSLFILVKAGRSKSNNHSRYTCDLYTHKESDHQCKERIIPLSGISRCQNRSINEIWRSRYFGFSSHPVSLVKRIIHFDRAKSDVSPEPSAKKRPCFFNLGERRS